MVWSLKPEHVVRSKLQGALDKERLTKALEYKVPLEFQKIQDAIHAAEDGGRIIVDSGLYEEDTLVIPEGLRVDIIRNPTHDNPAVIQVVSQTALATMQNTRLRLKSMTVRVIRDPKSQADMTVHGIQLDGGTTILDDIDVYGGVYGMMLLNGCQCKIKDSKISSSANAAVVVTQGSHVLAEGLTISDAGEDGILVSDPESKVELRASEILKCAAWGVRVLMGSMMVISNCTIKHCKLDGGISIGQESVLEVSHSTVRFNEGVAMNATSGGAVFADENDLRSNTLGPFYSSSKLKSSESKDEELPVLLGSQESAGGDAAITGANSALADESAAFAIRASNNISQHSRAPEFLVPPCMDFIHADRNIGVGENFEGVPDAGDGVQDEDGTTEMQLLVDEEGVPFGSNPVGIWLDHIGLEVYRPVFKALGIAVVQDLYFKRDTDLAKMGVTLASHRRIILQSLGRFAAQKEGVEESGLQQIEQQLVEHDEKRAKKKHQDNVEQSDAGGLRTLESVTMLARSLRRVGGGGGIAQQQPQQSRDDSDPKSRGSVYSRLSSSKQSKRSAKEESVPEVQNAESETQFVDVPKSPDRPMSKYGSRIEDRVVELGD